ncbi:MAG TPA: twin transmembrane helix small protein [Dongiaceae bacterium]
MSMFFFIIALVCAAATLVILLLGIVGLGTGGTFNQRYSNKLMRSRVIFQGLAIVSLIIAFATRG